MLKWFNSFHPSPSFRAFIVTLAIVSALILMALVVKLISFYLGSVAVMGIFAFLMIYWVVYNMIS